MPSFFSNTRPGREVTHGSATFELPILYFRDDVFALFFTADPAAVKALMPSDRLHPVTLIGRRPLVGFMALNYIDTTIGPYGEVAVGIPVVHGDRAPRGPLPGLLESRYPGFGFLVLHLPVTKAVARDAGRGEWGYTKFISEMHFDITPEHQECRLSERGAHLLTMRVARQGLTLRDNKPLITYSVKNGALIRTVIPQKGICRNALRPSGSYLQLGDHPVAQSIRALGLSPRPVMSRYFVERSGILPSGEVVERAVRPLEGYAGADIEGTLGVSYR